MGIGDKLNNILKERNRNVNELAATIGVSPQTLYSIINRNNTKVDLDVLQKIADELSVTLDYFCTESINTTDKYILTSIEKQLIDDFRNLSEQGRDYILQTMDLVKERYKKDTYFSNVETKVG